METNEIGSEIGNSIMNSNGVVRVLRLESSIIKVQSIYRKINFFGELTAEIHLSLLIEKSREKWIVFQPWSRLTRHGFIFVLVHMRTVQQRPRKYSKWIIGNFGFFKN